MREYYNAIAVSVKLSVAFFLIFYTDQKPLDLAQAAEVKHILVGNKVCSN